MKYFAIALVLAAAAGFLPASAKDYGTKEAMARGFGTQSCAEFGKQYAENPQLTEAMSFSWALGYMSATNVMLWASGADKYHDLGGDADSQEDQIRQYCDAHPLANYVNAVLDIYSRLPLKPIPKEK